MEIKIVIEMPDGTSRKWEDIPDAEKNQIGMALNRQCLTTLGYKEKKIKQNAFAESLGYSASKFNSMLQGRKLINVSDIVLIMRLLNIESDELFKGVK